MRVTEQLATRSIIGIVGRMNVGLLGRCWTMRTSTEKRRVVSGHVAVNNGKEEQKTHCERKIESSSIAIDQMGGYEMIMDNEAHTEDADQFPKMDNFMPKDALLQSARDQISRVDRLLQTAYDEGEEESREPNDEIDKLFIPFDMLDHEWFLGANIGNGGKWCKFF